MLKWLAVGVGDIATKRAIPAILAEPRSSLVGLVSREPGKCNAYGVRGFTDLNVALADSGADAVYIATPVFLHKPQTNAALRAGKHVLCEKPMALNYADAASMTETAASTGRTLGIAYYRRMYPKVRRAKELIQSGSIGRVVLAEATSHDWFNPSETGRSWLGDPERAGGGPLFDIACHRIDLMNYLFGKPARATGHRSTLVQPIAVEDNATVVIEYESGVRGIVDVRWHSRVPRDEFRVRGTDGELDLSPLNGNSLVTPTGVERLPAHENLHYPCVEDFVTAVLGGTEPRSSGATALAAEWVLGQAST